MEAFSLAACSVAHVAEVKAFCNFMHANLTEYSCKFAIYRYFFFSTRCEIVLQRRGVRRAVLPDQQLYRSVSYPLKLTEHFFYSKQQSLVEFHFELHQVLFCIRKLVLDYGYFN